jgi:2-amino-4-hydroxy-6-hydroxymethyldihydropteridine diphosphokinase
MHKVYLGIGGNIGNKQKNFEEVYKAIKNKLGNIKNTSSVYETPPWGFHSSHKFWNSVVEISTTLSAEEVLSEIHSIERQFGRKHGVTKYSSREMDIDVLYYDDIYIETESLVIPHPSIQLRKFVLVPLSEIAPDFKHPLLRLTSIEMLENCRDVSIIRKLKRLSI